MGPNGSDLDAQFVSQDTWVFKERLIPSKGMPIGAADAHTSHICANLPWTRLSRVCDVDGLELSGGMKLDRNHSYLNKRTGGWMDNMKKADPVAFSPDDT